MQNSDFLKNKFEHFNADVPPKVWDNVAAALDKKKKRRSVFWWFSGVAAVLFVGLFVGYFWQAAQNTSVVEAKSFGVSLMNAVFGPTHVHNTKLTNIDSTSETPEQQTSFNSVSLDKPSRIKKRNHRNQVPERFDEPYEYDMQELVYDELVPIYEPFIIPDPKKNDDDVALSDLNSDPQESTQSESAAHPSVLSTDDNEFKPKKWELALIGGFSATKQMNSTYFQEPAMANSPNLEFTVNNADYLNIGESDSNFISPVIRFTLIKAGISINRELTPRWRLESGLHYLRYGVFFENSQSWSREAQMIQVPVSAHFSIIRSNVIDWRIGSGVGMSYVFRQADPVFRGEWVNNTTVMFKLQQSWSLFVQPEARMVFYDSRITQVGKLSQWYWGMNLGVVKRF